MKNIFSSKRSIVIAVSVLMAAVICCIGVLMYQNYILSHTVNGKLINEQDYIGLTREEATKELNKDGLIIKVEEINGNKHTIHTAEGSCNGFMWVTIRDNYITKARFETGDPSC